ncbi:glycosyl hydrolase-related protein [Paenibacillus pinihumi]|uniref:glycoside hydrolase family 38 N-terminal domain-containing protein n=1 Tax=Paenibacillus pinihumi TaxID=669462 RepID=UPI0004191F93|nr:glycosyl hydrolase-related protein [Paenibacillus pinihumi]
MSKIKEILILHHSHLDVGYTHSQPVLIEMHKKYIDQALEMCELTEDWAEENKFRWTCEASYPVLRWLDTASGQQIQKFRQFLQNGQMSITASFLHSTPLVTAEQLARMLQPVKEIRSRLGYEIKTAIHHDVNGQPWPYSQLMLDAGVEFFIMGINVHFGGIPLTRPMAFHWETPDRRKLLTFNGEHYSLFSQICNVNALDTNIMAEGLARYLEKIDANPDYPFDFVYLTATNLPLYDNGPPDRELAGVIKRWNGENREQKISFVTPEQLYARVKKHEENLPVHSGDWTDYWNFGSGSSAKETKLNRRTKQGMKTAELLNAFQREYDPSYVQIEKQAWEQIHLYDEHTWGTFNSVTEPDHLNVEIQWMHKAHYAYLANSLTGYLLGVQMEKIASNPLQSDEPEGILVLNSSSVPVTHDIRIPSSFTARGRHLSADRSRQILMNTETDHSATSYGIIELPPFSWRKIPLNRLQEAAMSEDITIGQGAIYGLDDVSPAGFRQVQSMTEALSRAQDITVDAGSIETPFHKCSFDPSTGRILSLYDKKADWEVLDVSSPWSLFQYVQETIDPTCQRNHRSTIFPRDLEKGNNSISVWNHNWSARRLTHTGIKSCHVERSAHSATLVLQFEAPGVEDLEQRFTFFSHRADIEMKASYYKQDITTPEGTYFAIPLNLKQWRCHYDTAGQFVELDAGQLPGVCRDYMTVDKSVSVYDGSHGATLVCPDAPLVQVGNFNFGKEQKRITRDSNPLLLAWPMNNYWDTNFRARQPGFASFTYTLTTFSQFDPVITMQAAVEAVSPVVTVPVIDCKKEEAGQFIQITGNGVQVFDVKPAEEEAGIILRLGNCTDEHVDVRLHFPERRIKAAYKTNVLEEIQTEISCIHNDTIEFGLEAKQMLHLLVVFEG